MFTHRKLFKMLLKTPVRLGVHAVWIILQLNRGEEHHLK
jgi:hypothetical protein